MDVSVGTGPRDGTIVVAVEGEIDLGTAGYLEQAIIDAIGATDKGVVVDLADVTFLDSSGISALLKGRRLADDRGIGYRVTNAGNIVRQVLDMTGVWDHLSGQSA